MTTSPPPLSRTSSEGATPGALDRFRSWMVSLDEDQAYTYGVKGSVEEPLRLLRAYVRLAQYHHLLIGRRLLNAPTKPQAETPAETLEGFRSWALGLDEVQVCTYGAEGGVEETLRLLRAFAAQEDLLP
jgi:hypothetical protein